MELNKNQYVLYKGLPLVRDGDVLCYGDLNEKYILTLNILAKDASENPNMIMVQICHTNDRNKIVKGKQAFKKDLFEALDLGGIWLDKLNRIISILLKLALFNFMIVGAYWLLDFLGFIPFFNSYLPVFSLNSFLA